MLELGVFGGVYFADQPEEFPTSWCKDARLSPDHKQYRELNYLKAFASHPLSVLQ
jgi:hypothetical protein